MPHTAIASAADGDSRGQSPPPRDVRSLVAVQIPVGVAVGVENRASFVVVQRARSLAPVSFVVAVVWLLAISWPLVRVESVDHRVSPAPILTTTVELDGARQPGPLRVRPARAQQEVSARVR